MIYFKKIGGNLIKSLLFLIYIFLVGSSLYLELLHYKDYVTGIHTG